MGHNQGIDVSSIRFVQCNLRHSINASEFILKKYIDICLIQEPWINKFLVKGLTSRYFNLFYKTVEGKNPRSCILISKNFNAFLLNNFSDADCTTVKLEDGHHSLTVVSSYLDRNLPAPTACLRQVVEENTRSAHANLIIGCDANARHTIWGSSEINSRGEYLFDFITNSRLVIDNVGNTPTFICPTYMEGGMTF